MSTVFTLLILKERKSLGICSVPENKGGKTVPTRFDFFLLANGNSFPEVKKPPPNFHHLRIRLVHGSPSNQNKWRVRCSEKRSIAAQLYIFLAEVFWSW